MEKLTFTQLSNLFYAHNKNIETKGKVLKGVIVFTENSFTKPFNETERSYKVTSDNYGFIPGKISSAIYGDCLDGRDNGVRLDWYMRDEHQPWRVDYCYLLEEGENDAGC